MQAQEEAARAAELKRRSKVLQRGLPRPALPGDQPAGPAPGADGPGLPPRERAERLLAQELAALLAHDNAKYPLKVGGCFVGLIPVSVDVCPQIFEGCHKVVIFEGMVCSGGCRGSQLLLDVFHLVKKTSCQFDNFSFCAGAQEGQEEEGRRCSCRRHALH
jgi:pre-mRNA splicing factor component